MFPNLIEILCTTVSSSSLIEKTVGLFLDTKGERPRTQTLFYFEGLERGGTLILVSTRLNPYDLYSNPRLYSCFDLLIIGGNFTFNLFSGTLYEFEGNLPNKKTSFPH